ncbi:MAG: hypothetical protein HYZ68_03365 [Chloroflexi bacterium]|nr:hypothetical protein [Chloroflexota bacterium]
MKSYLQKARGYLAIITALIACPCHLPITLLLLIGLAGGTALGTFLSQNALLIYAASTVYFLGALWIGWRWLGEGGKGHLKPATTGEVESRGGGGRKVGLVTSSVCADCEPTRELASRTGIHKVPTALIDGEVVLEGIPSREQALAALRRGG